MIRKLTIALPAMAALASPAAAAAGPALVLDRPCAVSIPVDSGTQFGSGEAFFHGTGFRANGAGFFNYTSVPTGATAPPNGAGGFYFQADADASGLIDDTEMLPPRVATGTKPQLLRGVATAVGTNFDDQGNQTATNPVSMSVAVPGTIAPRTVRAGTKLRVRGFGLGLLNPGGATVFAHFVQGNRVTKTVALGAPRGCGLVDRTIKAPVRGAYTLLLTTSRHTTAAQIGDPTFAAKVTVRR